MGFVANMVSLVLYFYGVMHFDLSSSANTLTNFMGSTFLLSLVGGFISDTYFNRLTTCLLFGSLEVIVSIISQKLQIPNPNAMFQSYKIKETTGSVISSNMYCACFDFQNLNCAGFGDDNSSSCIEEFTPRSMW